MKTQYVNNFDLVKKRLLKNVSKTSLPSTRYRLPFYYEVKILFLVWLLSPVTKGSSIIYRKLIHKQLSKHEKVQRMKEGGRDVPFVFL